MPNNSSSSTKAPKSVKKTPAKRAKASKRSKDSDKKAEQSLIDVGASVYHGDANESEQSLIADDTSDTVREDQTFGQGELKNVNEYLKGKVGTDILAKHWLKDCKLSSLEKSMVILGLAYELCLAKDPGYDLENEAAENNKQNNFDTKRIFHILKYVTAKVLPEDRKKFTEFICESGNVKLLEMICKQENKDGGGKAKIDRQYSWKGEFTGYERLIDLLQYVLKQGCSSEIVLCTAKKVYGNAHIIYNGEQYLGETQVTGIKGNFNYSDSVIKDCLKTAIELGYKDVVSVMLSGDIYYCIRLMKGEKFQEWKKALKMIEETVAEVMSSWVNCKQDLSKEVKGLLEEGIEIDIEKMEKKNLIDELESRGIEVKNRSNTTQKELVEMLKEEEGGKVRLRLRKTVVGGLILVLFFNYQNELMKEPFKLKISDRDEIRKEKEINELNKNIDKKDFLEKKVLEKIKLLNKSSHVFNNWFFREVLTAIVNDEEKLGKLKAVCTAICKEKVEELLEGAEVHEDVADALKFFGVKPNQIKTSTPKKGHSVVSVSSHFSQEIEETDKALREVKGIVREMSKWGGESSEYEILSLVKIFLSDKTPAFSGLSRKIIVELKSKKKEKDIKSDEVKKLKEAVNQILGEIKKGIDILAKGDSEYCIDTEDISKHFEIINSEIKKEDKREIVELVCQKDNVKLLEMICQQENKDGGGKAKVGQQYSWKGEFTGYERLTDLLQYTLKQPCSSEIVLCIAKKVYGNAHIIYNGEQYLGETQVTGIKGNFNYSDSVIKDCLKTAIELGYKDVVSVMLSGDIYHCIRLMKGEKFQEWKKALKMIEETVAEVWVNGERQSFKDDVQRLLAQGIEIDIEELRKQDLIDELEDRGIKLYDKDKKSKGRLVEKLRGEGGEKVRLSRTVVGSLISTLFFNYQKELTEKPFKIKILHQDESKRKKEINELKEKIDNKSFVKEKVLEKIKLLNKSSYQFNNWFFREVLSAIVNDEERLGELKAVCAAICKEPMQKLLRGAEVHEDVVDTLGFFGVDLSKIDLSTVGSVESQDFEYAGPSSEQFLTETNKLSGQDIVDIAKYYYRWMEPINGKYLEEEVFFTCTDVPSLEDKLKHYKEIQQKDLIFTSIINTGKDHWVTLVVARSVKDGKFSAYYCDSFGKGLSKKMLDVLKKALKIDANRISSSRIKQQEDEYNCGIFALANANKITRIIKDKSFTEINVELKGKFDAGQLRKEFAKKVEEMRQKSGEANVDSKYEGHDSEAVQVGDSVENECTLSKVPHGSKAVEKKNEEVMQNNCRQNQGIYYSKGKVPIIAPSGNIFSEGKMVGKRKRDWAKSNNTINKPARTGINIAVPKFPKFVNMFDEFYRSKLLEYEFGYDRLQFLCRTSGSNSASNVKVGDMGAPSKDDEELEVIFEAYRLIVVLLMKGEKEKAVSKLEDLLDEEDMPSAQYALAIIKFKDLLKDKAAKREEGKESRFSASQVIEWLRSDNLENYLRPLNWSLLLRVQQYDIGGYGKEVEQMTRLNREGLLYRVLSSSKDIGIKFDSKLVRESSLLRPGDVIVDDEKRKIDARFFVQCAMYELLKQKVLERDLRKESICIEDAFVKISEILPQKGAEFVHIFEYIRAEIMYLHAIYLLIHKVGEDHEKERAVELLTESCKFEHPGALYLRGVLLFDRKDFEFISSDSELFDKCFKGLKSFAVLHKNETAACIIANEYLRDDRLVQVKNEEDAKKKAQEVLEKSGCKYIWEDLMEKQTSRKEVKRQCVVDLSNDPALNPPEPMLCDNATKNIFKLDVESPNSFPRSYVSPCTELSKKRRDGKFSELRGKGSITKENVKQDEGDNLWNTPKSNMTSRNALLSSTPSPTQTAKGMNRNLRFKNKENESPTDNINYLAGANNSRNTLIVNQQVGSPFGKKLFVSPNTVCLPTNDINYPDRTMPSSTPSPTQTAFIWDNLDPSNKHFGIFLSPAGSKVRRLSNFYNNTVDYNVSSGIGVILSYRNKGQAEPDVLDLSVRKSGCSYFQDDFNKAIEFCKNREYDKAFKVYQEILSKRRDVPIMGNRDFELAYYNEAVVLYAQGKYDSALEVFQTAANDRDCEWASVAWYNVAVIFCKQERYSDALEALQKVQGSEHNIPSIKSDIRMLEKQISKSSDNPSTSVHDVGLERMDTSMSLHYERREK